MKDERCLFTMIPLGADRGGSPLKNLTSCELHQAVGEALAEVSRRLESGEMDGSGRYYTDEELAAGAATGGKPAPAKRSKATAA